MNELKQFDPCPVKGYWIICVNSYEFEGVHIPKGRMVHHTSKRQILNPDWQKATQEEIDTRKYFKGNAFNLMRWKQIKK